MEKYSRTVLNAECKLGVATCVARNVDKKNLGVTCIARNVRDVSKRLNFIAVQESDGPGR